MSLIDVNLYASSIRGKQYDDAYNSNAKAAHPLSVGVLGQGFGVRQPESTSIIGTTARSSCNRQANMTTTAILLQPLLCMLNILLLLFWTATRLGTHSPSKVRQVFRRSAIFKTATEAIIETHPSNFTLALKSRVKNRVCYNSSRASQRTSCSKQSLHPPKKPRASQRTSCGTPSGVQKSLHPPKKPSSPLLRC